MGALAGTGGGCRRDRSAADAAPMALATASTPADENRNPFMFYPPVHGRATTYSVMQQCLVRFRGFFVISSLRIKNSYLDIIDLSPQQCHLCGPAKSV